MSASVPRKRQAYVQLTRHQCGCDDHRVEHLLGHHVHGIHHHVRVSHHGHVPHHRDARSLFLISMTLDELMSGSAYSYLDEGGGRYGHHLRSELR